MLKKTKQNTDDKREMPFLDHLEELRWRIIKCLISVLLFTGITFPFTHILLDLLTRPNTNLSEPAKLIFLKPTGMLAVRVEIAVVTGIIASLFVIYYQFWQFIKPGLHKKERKYFIPGLIMTTFCFLSGALFAYFMLIPVVLPFLFNLGTQSITATINITEYISFVLRLILVAGLLFELPVISFFLSNIGLLSSGFLKKYRRYGILLIFIFAAIFTPPDPVSQILMALPLIILYEISILVALIGQRKKTQRDRDWQKSFDQNK